VTPVEQSSLNVKAAMAERRREASRILLRAGFVAEAVVIEWTALRFLLFAWLEKQEIAYNGTRGALVIVLDLVKPLSLEADLVFIYHVATLCEWDEQFVLSSAQASSVLTTCDRVYKAVENELFGSLHEKRR